MSGGRGGGAAGSRAGGEDGGGGPHFRLRPEHECVLVLMTSDPGAGGRLPCTAANSWSFLHGMGLSGSAAGDYREHVALCREGIARGNLRLQQYGVPDHLRHGGLAQDLCVDAAPHRLRPALRSPARALRFRWRPRP